MLTYYNRSFKTFSHILSRCYRCSVKGINVFSPSRRNYSLVPGEDELASGKTTVTILNQEQENVLLIDTFNEFGFRLNSGIFVMGPMAIFPRTVLRWNVRGASDVDETSLSVIKVLEPAIDVVIVSFGEKDQDAENKVSKLLFSRKINFEILPTFQACSTFNFLNAEHRYVAGLFIPPKVIVPQNVERMNLSVEEKAMLREPV